MVRRKALKSVSTYRPIVPVNGDGVKNLDFFHGVTLDGVTNGKADSTAEDDATLTWSFDDLDIIFALFHRTDSWRTNFFVFSLEIVVDVLATLEFTFGDFAAGDLLPFDIKLGDDFCFSEGEFIGFWIEERKDDFLEVFKQLIYDLVGSDLHIVIGSQLFD